MNKNSKYYEKDFKLKKFDKSEMEWNIKDKMAPLNICH